jgi:HPt (histidine-containing phosphotransfer) domain-containing protein
MADLAGNIGAEGVKQVYAMYLADSAKLLTKMAAGVAKAERAVVIDAAHQLKATSGSVGATQVAKRCAELEQEARSGSADRWEELRAAVVDAFALVEAELRRRLA